MLSYKERAEQRQQMKEIQKEVEVRGGRREDGRCVVSWTDGNMVAIEWDACFAELSHTLLSINRRKSQSRSRSRSSTRSTAMSVPSVKKRAVAPAYVPCCLPACVLAYYPLIPRLPFAHSSLLPPPYTCPSDRAHPRAAEEHGGLGRPGLPQRAAGGGAGAVGQAVHACLCIDKGRLEEWGGKGREVCVFMWACFHVRAPRSLPSPSSSPSHLGSYSYDWKRFLEGLKGRADFKDGRSGLNWIAVGVSVSVYVDGCRYGNEKEKMDACAFDSGRGQPPSLSSAGPFGPINHPDTHTHTSYKGGGGPLLPERAGVRVPPGPAGEAP